MSSLKKFLFSQKNCYDIFVLFGLEHGLNKPATVKMEPENSWENYLLRPWLEKMTSECHRLGFKAIIMITGHYGHNQQIVVREVAIRMSERLQIPVLGIPEYWLALDAGYLGDHAGIGETSLLWHLEPDLVAIDRIRNDPDYGKNDRIEKGSSPELGQAYAELIIDRLACLALAMPKWATDKRTKFVTAERSILSSQIQGWRRRDGRPRVDGSSRRGLREPSQVARWTGWRCRGW